MLYRVGFFLHFDLEQTDYWRQIKLLILCQYLILSLLSASAILQHLLKGLKEA